jgi:hypothetical protein
MSNKQITKAFNKAGIYRGFVATKGEVELFIELGDTKTANEKATRRLFRRAVAALRLAGADWSAFRTGYGAWILACGKAAAVAARAAHRANALDQFGIEGA